MGVNWLLKKKPGGISSDVGGKNEKRQEKKENMKEKIGKKAEDKDKFEVWKGEINAKGTAIKAKRVSWPTGREEKYLGGGGGKYICF